MSHGKLDILFFFVVVVVYIVIFSIVSSCYIIYMILEPGTLMQPRSICCMNVLCHMYCLLLRIQRNPISPLFLKHRFFNQSPH